MSRQRAHDQPRGDWSLSRLHTNSRVRRVRRWLRGTGQGRAKELLRKLNVLAEGEDKTIQQEQKDILEQLFRYGFYFWRGQVVPQDTNEVLGKAVGEQVRCKGVWHAKKDGDGHVLVKTLMNNTDLLNRDWVGPLDGFPEPGDQRSGAIEKKVNPLVVYCDANDVVKVVHTPTPELQDCIYPESVRKVLPLDHRCAKMMVYALRLHTAAYGTEVAQKASGKRARDESGPDEQADDESKTKKACKKE